MSHTPFDAAFTPGTRFAGSRRVTIETSPRVIAELKVPTGRIIVCDPLATSFEPPGSPLSRSAPTGVFPVEVVIARFENGDERVACARVRFAGDSKPVRWEVASFAGEPAPAAGAIPGYGVDAGMGCFFDGAACGGVEPAVVQAWLAAAASRQVNTWTWHAADVGGANVVMFSSGWGDGFYGSFWGLDAGDRVVALATDFQVLMGPASESFELPLPLSRGGAVQHPLLEAHGITLRGAWLSRTTAVLTGKGAARLELSNGEPVTMQRKGDEREYSWGPCPAGVRLVVHVMVGVKPLDVI
jgi:hypothetical protein